MPAGRAEVEIWKAIAAGDEQQTRTLLTRLPATWLAQQASGAASLAHAKGHLALADWLRQEVATRLAEDDRAAQMADQLRVDLQNARAAAASKSAFIAQILF